MLDANLGLLLYGEVSVMSRTFGNSLDLRLVGDLHFLLPTEHESVGKKKFFSLRD